jgi:hypothetical protein
MDGNLIFAHDIEGVEELGLIDCCLLGTLVEAPLCLFIFNLPVATDTCLTGSSIFLT